MADAIAKTLLDTDIFSELMRGKNEVVRARAHAYLEQHERLTISTITVLEVVKGLHKMRRDDALERFIQRLDALEVLSMGRDEAIIGGRLYGDLERLGQPIGRADPMIAGVAIAHGLVLATGNGEHYAWIRAAGHDLVLDNWRIAASESPRSEVDLERTAQRSPPMRRPGVEQVRDRAAPRAQMRRCRNEPRARA